MDDMSLSQLNRAFRTRRLNADFWFLASGFWTLSYDTPNVITHPLRILLDKGGAA
jgi:hypothetical protein